MNALRIQPLSDIHFDVQPLAHPVRLADGVDVLVVAGDICEGARNGFEWLRERFPKPLPIVAVMGNHTFYRRAYDEEMTDARAAAAEHGITLLENDAAVIGGVRFLGGALWTDYRLYGEAWQANAMRTAMDKSTGMNDHRRIKWRKDPWKRFRPEEALQLHTKTRAFIDDELSKPFDGPSVVVTHHAPSPKSIDDRYGDKMINAAYASDLEKLIGHHQPELWLHGHIHLSKDYQLGDTRVICNPMGYGSENPGFNPEFVVDVVKNSDDRGSVFERIAV